MPKSTHKSNFAGFKFSAKDVIVDMSVLSEEEFYDKYIGILFSDEAEFKAFVDRVNSAVEVAFSEITSVEDPVKRI